MLVAVGSFVLGCYRVTRCPYQPPLKLGEYHFVRELWEFPDRAFDTDVKLPLLKEATVVVDTRSVVIDYAREADGSRWRVTYEVIGTARRPSRERLPGDQEPNVCFPACDPLRQDCPEAPVPVACYPSIDRFACMPTHDPTSAYGEECGMGRRCEAGLLCSYAQFVPGCTGRTCCTKICDTRRPNSCPHAEQGQECLPWWKPGEGPADLQHVGSCKVP